MIVDWKGAVEFSAKPVTVAEQSADKTDVLNRADTYHKSYFMVQLYNKDNFSIGTNGSDILMSQNFGK